MSRSWPPPTSISTARQFLELIDRYADGRAFFDDDPPARVRWTATTRKIYADEQPRLRRSHREFAEAVRRGR